jgi:hypothetical protein
MEVVLGLGSLRCRALVPVFDLTATGYGVAKTR